MAKEVNIEVKANGISQIRSELKALKGELANATDPAEMERLSAAAGKLSDKLSDANARVKAFATESKFEGVANGLGLVGDNLKNMDFGDASRGLN